MMVCSNAVDLSTWSAIIGLAAVLSMSAVALIYMFGTAFRSRTIGAWARIELYQIAATIAFVAGAAFFINTASLLDVGFFSSYYTLLPPGSPPIATGTAVDYCDAAEIYLTRVQELAYGSYALVRNTLMDWELMVSKSTYQCPVYCLLFQNGWSEEPGLGYYASFGAGYFALNSLIIGLLSISSLLYMLNYAANGALLWLFPIGALFRSLPYMRGFGGALMALALALFFGLPFLLFLNSLLAYPVLTSIYSPGSPLLPTPLAAPLPLAGIAVLSAAISFTTVFLTALDFVVLAIFARELANLFGGEIDITRLATLV